MFVKTEELAIILLILLVLTNKYGLLMGQAVTCPALFFYYNLFLKNFKLYFIFYCRENFFMIHFFV